jgi:DNA-binding transcriptional LysR family regulator
LSRRVVATLSNLVLAPLIVSQTDLVCTAVERTLLPYTAGLGLRALPAPFESPELQLDLIWHERAHHDPGHAWFRDALLDLFRGA